MIAEETMHGPDDPKAAARSSALYPLLAINFIGVLGFSIVLPFLVFLVTGFGGNAFVYGLAGAMYPAFQLIGAPVLGRWSDLHGRRRVILFSHFGTLVSWGFFLLALVIPVTTILSVDSEILGAFVISLPLVVIFFARALDGLTGGNVSVANAYLADITAEEERSKNYGRMSISSNLGFILGPTLAGILGSTIYGEIIPVLAAIVISIVAMAVIIYWLPESAHCSLKQGEEHRQIRKVFGMEQTDCTATRTMRKTGVREIMALRFIPFMLVLYFFIFLSFNIFYSSFSVHAVEGLQWTVAGLGLFFSFLSISMIVVQGPVLSRASKRYAETSLIVFGSIMLGINFLLLLSPDIRVIYLAALFFALGNGLMWPSFISLLSKTAGNENQGAVQGFAGSAGSLASIIGLIIGGVLYGTFGATSFIIAAAVIFGVSILAFRLKSLQARPDEPATAGAANGG
jgi:DHA1 family tetracycline resistance protein-like MFS transporter